jgi:membrane dipeptidase
MDCPLVIQCVFILRKEQSPYELDTVADPGRLEGLLEQGGYGAEEVINVLHGNWLRFLRQAWR